MPRVAELPPGWRDFSTAAKVEHLIGLDRAARILSWGPLGELDPLRASYVLQVMRILFQVGVTAILQGKVDREVLRERELQEAAERFRRAMERSAARHEA
jgi:hypothetical protein